MTDCKARQAEAAIQAELAVSLRALADATEALKRSMSLPAFADYARADGRLQALDAVARALGIQLAGPASDLEAQQDLHNAILGAAMRATEASRG